MADKKKKNLTPEAQQYQSYQEKREVKRPIFKNCIKAFFVGGTICLIGQAISTFYIYYFDFTEQTAGNPTVATLIFITMFLTGFGVYDRIGQFAGAGSAVPVTGFGNAVVASAIEHRTEGFVLGVGSNMLKLAGPVIVYGVFSAFVVALIKTILIKWGGL
ncbi:stage V sporulation protein AC [Virgibacillus halodenitrificans]|uniref:Stage V sporulation protein AC n=1 Tax=Virgibacillus halodenitrificans TaxID=1482 RepID=A0ABR7VTT0_VIRHA|nr:stage V sporulation protein AC [Virgibacillus halodenitrificans]MBD1224373.1 stage V sporulation protein AC [Virgibacillus halodenitrificans]MEC2158449.1 stage V sporulation protein AC [Virgibacillus halodenitrificans]MYL47329.1 stage V sporulation protein AC [Virgibacillus halodenitrificans]MYL57423.1 stage V sporulation protein AC [Virgibacillus halodenitrificans]WHX26985.1 stage V sporulation protein AC [Virgibacillus halodenitrificans]